MFWKVSFRPSCTTHDRRIRRGLLQGYRREEDALHTVRGRIRFADQINQRHGVLLPLEVAYDEFTEDIEENRLLKTALHRLSRLPVRSAEARRGINALRPVFNTVGLATYAHGAPEIRYTRLNGHYRPAVELARLIIDCSSLELHHGDIAGSSFLLDMNRVFEQFLFVALREELGLSASEWRKGNLTLDEGDAIKLEPDLSWWAGRRCRFVGDAKYKRLDVAGFRHADMYQMLAYCTASGLASGLLVYAAGEEESSVHRVRNAGKTIEVASLDLEGTPDMILAEVRRIAGRVRSMAGIETGSAGWAGKVRPGTCFRRITSSQRLEHQLRHHHLPRIAAEAVPVFGLGTLPIPGGDGHDHTRGATHTGGNLKATCHLSDHRSAGVQQFPAIRPPPQSQRVTRGQVGDCPVQGMNLGSVSGKAQEHVPQAQTPVAAGQFGRGRREMGGPIAVQHRRDFLQGIPERMRPGESEPASVSCGRGSWQRSTGGAVRWRPRWRQPAPNSRPGQQRDRTPVPWRDGR